MNRIEALAVLKDAITQIVPDADFDHVGVEDKFRDALELDSLDFVRLVEIVSTRTGVRIDEEDYADLTTLSDAADFLVARGHPGQ
ncbi:acyl carrier protein [Actinomycetota bacterium Odt1-20B]